MNKEPLTELERTGLVTHGLPTDTPSQLSDSFRAGIAWALQFKKEQREKAVKARIDFLNKRIESAQTKLDETHQDISDSNKGKY